ncbi:hypothetical protein Mithridates_00177 [Acinetobacter phage Mithridates]|nr:hypothetical protein Mithridates_00177 [Acinetobacter phage Mithridates]
MSEEYREEFVDNFTRYSCATQSWIKYSVGDRIKLGSPRWNTSFMKSYGILEGHVGKIVQIKKLAKMESLDGKSTLKTLYGTINYLTKIQISWNFTSMKLRLRLIRFKSEI